jgi:hypothetical protein
MVRILANDNNRRGDFFTRLMAAVLEKCGYTIGGRDVAAAGYEIDLRAKPASAPDGECVLLAGRQSD